MNNLAYIDSINSNNKKHALYFFFKTLPSLKKKYYICISKIIVLSIMINSMENKELYSFCKSLGNERTIVFPKDVYAQITKEQAKIIAEDYLHSRLMQLPEPEIKFFEWLKSADRPVWDDLWAEQMDGPYIVSISFLPVLKEIRGRGFPICDLMNCDNYYFTKAHMVDFESEIVLDSSKKRFMDKKSMTLAQMLAVEISIAPIDLWRFCYRHKISIEEAKEAVAVLVDDEALVHLKEAEHLAYFIDF
jgi:hypothetical protein